MAFLATEGPLSNNAPTADDWWSQQGLNYPAVDPAAQQELTRRLGGNTGFTGGALGGNLSNDFFINGQPASAAGGRITTPGARVDTSVGGGPGLGVQGPPGTERAISAGTRRGDEVFDPNDPLLGGQGAVAPPQNGDYQTWFNQLIAGKPFNQQTLLDLEPTLKAAGVQLTPPNASGDRTKIGIPDGKGGTQWVRVGFGEGKPVWQPQPAQGQAGANTGASQLYNPNDLTAGFTSAFQAPTAEQAAATPGFEFTLGQGLQAIDRGASARGTLLTMGNQKDRAQFASGLASQTYGQTYDRAMQEYLNAFNIFNTNQGNLFNRNFALSGQGLSAAGGAAGAATRIGEAGATAATNAGNATAAGAVQRGNSNVGIAQNLGELGLGLVSNLFKKAA